MNRLRVIVLCVLLAAFEAGAQAPPADEVAPDELFLPWSPSGEKEAPTPPPDEKRSKGEEEGEEEAEEAPPDDAAATLRLGAPVAEPPVTEPPVTEPPVAPPVTAPPLPPPATPPAAAVVEKPSPRDFNRVSLYGGMALGQWNRALGFYLGFPLVGLRVGMGLLDRLDVGVGFDTFYGAMNEPRAFVKYQVVSSPRFSLAAQVEGGAAFFAQKPEVDLRGARWLTGRRNYNVEGGVVASWQGDSVQSARLFADARYHLGLDTQPFTKDPLGGVPPAVQTGHNVNLRFGAEMPFSPSTSFLFVFGFDLHGRAEDAPFMPVVSVGLVTGI